MGLPRGRSTRVRRPRRRWPRPAQSQRGVRRAPVPSPSARDEQWAAEAVIRSGYAKLSLWLDSWHWARVGLYPGASGRSRARRDPPDAYRDSRRHRQPGHAGDPGDARHHGGWPHHQPPDRLAFRQMEGKEFLSLAELDGRYFSTEVAGGFTGRVIGVSAVAGGAEAVRTIRVRAPRPRQAAIRPGGRVRLQGGELADFRGDGLVVRQAQDFQPVRPGSRTTIPSAILACARRPPSSRRSASRSARGADRARRGSGTTGSAPGIGCHAAVGRGAVEVQQHGLRFRLDDGHRDVVPGEGADRLGGFPERVRGQLDGAVPVKVAAQQVRAGEAGQLAQLGQQRAVEVAAVVFPRLRRRRSPTRSARSCRSPAPCQVSWSVRDIK